MTFVFPNRKQLYLSCGLSYNYEILFADRHGYSVESDITKSETGSKVTHLEIDITFPLRMVRRFGRNLAARCRMTCPVQ